MNSAEKSRREKDSVSTISETSARLRTGGCPIGTRKISIPPCFPSWNAISEDVSWMVEKFDYRNKDADWKNSKDAIQRGMQKLKGGYPADGPYKMSK